MNPSLSAWASDRLPKFVLIAASSLFILLFIWNAAQRVPYPYELEWMEGGVVCHVQRVLDGKDLYCAPSVDYVPFIYTPFYYYVSAVPARVMGLGFTPLRLLSFLSSLGCAALIMLIAVRRYSVTPLFGFVGACFFLASFCPTGRWLDVARVDALFLMLLLLAIYLFQSPRPMLSSVAAALVMFLAFFTKQTALMIAVPLCMWSVCFRQGWQRFAFTTIFVASLVLSTLLGDALSDGWYSYYVFSLPRQHPVYKPFLWQFLRTDILGHAAIAFTIAIIYVARLGDFTLRKRLFDVIVFGSMFVAAWASRLHSGGYLNVLLPVYAVMAIYFGIGLSWAATRLDGRKWLRLIVYIIAIAQFQQLFYWPSQSLPRETAASAGDKLKKTIASVDGDVLISFHPWYAAESGKSASAQQMAIADIFRANGSETVKEQLNASILDRISKQAYGAIILDAIEYFGTSQELRENYDLVDSHLTTADFSPVTGRQLHPVYLFLPKGRGERASKADTHDAAAPKPQGRSV